MSIESNMLNSQSPDSGLEKKRITLEDVEVFGEKLKEAKRRENILPKDIAALLGFSVSTINHWERGEAFPEVSELSNIARVYGINENELRKAFEISQKARELEKMARNPKKIIQKEKSDTEIYGATGYPIKGKIKSIALGRIRKGI